MRLFGILLIVANLIAGGAFVYLATQDWKGRQTINAAGLRHLLLLQGLPLEGSDFSADDETPFVMNLGGGESTKTISKKLLETYFRDNTAAAPAAPATGTDPAAPAPVSLTQGASVVTNQLAEVKRVQGVCKAELAKDGLTPDAKIALLRVWLLLQAETIDLRNLYLDLIAPTDASGQAKSADQRKADAAKLEELLDARFNAVINKPDGAQSVPPAELPDLTTLADDLKKRQTEMSGLLAEEERVEKGGMKADEKLRAAIQTKREDIQKAQKDLGAASALGRSKLEQVASQRASGTPDEGERRLKLAHLLVHLDPDPVWQKRVSVIVGLRRYVKAISAQVGRFKDMVEYIEAHIPGDQARFLKHETQLREQATQSGDRARVIAEEKAKLVEQKTKEDDSVNRQRTQLKELTDLLNKIKAEVDESLVRQAGIEKQLFEIQREVGLTLEEVYRLEELLDATQRERLGLPPRSSRP